MARKGYPYIEPKIPNDGFPPKPPLTANDAMRASGMLPHAFGRSPFLRRTVDMIDRAEMEGEDALERLHRFVQDWQHHARAPMLVELGDVLAWLTETLPGSDVFEDLLHDISMAGVKDITDAEDIVARLKESSEWEASNDFVGELRTEYGIGRVDTIELLRKKLIDDRSTESVDEVWAELKASEEQQVAELKKQNAEIRAELQGLLNRIGHLHNEAARVAGDVFGATPTVST